MIRVTCEACGKSFGAKDELAGRKGKCPGCGEPIVVPQAGAAPAAPAPARAAPAASRSSKGSGGSRRASTKTHVRRPGGKTRSKGGAGTVVVVVLAALGMAWAAWALSGDEDMGRVAFNRGQTAISDMEWAVAVEAFESIPPESTFHALAQEKLAEAIGQRDAEEALAKSKGSDNLYLLIKSVEKNYVLPEAPSGSYYQPYARYLLKRCKDFVERFPDDARSQELRQYDFKYAKVASLTEPPTEADVDAELQFRCMMPAPNYKLAAEAVAEFQALNPQNTDAVRRLRDRMQDSSQEYWKNIHGKLVNGGDLEPGKENWQRVANQTFRYLDAVDGVAGILPAADARALYNKATNGG
jgi:hypothetical protein